MTVIPFPTPVPTCPDCGSTFTLDDRAEKEVHFVPPYHLRWAPVPTCRVRVAVAFCNGCENVIELDTRL